MVSDLPSDVADYLAAHSVMTLASIGLDGPWAAAVFYAHEGASLYFLSAPTTRHARNLAHDARCAAAIQDDVASWSQVRGIQLEGRASRLDGDAARQAHQVYARKFPLVAHPARAPAAIALAFAKIAWYRLDAGRVHLIDNRRGFGHRDSHELDMDRRAGGVQGASACLDRSTHAIADSAKATGASPRAGPAGT